MGAARRAIAAAALPAARQALRCSVLLQQRQLPPQRLVQAVLWSGTRGTFGCESLESRRTCRPRDLLQQNDDWRFSATEAGFGAGHR